MVFRSPTYRCLLYAGNNLIMARLVFERGIKHRSRIRLIIRQRARVLAD
jgi:hypothetical protein